MQIFITKFQVDDQFSIKVPQYEWSQGTIKANQSDQLMQYKKLILFKVIFIPDYWKFSVET